MTKVKHNFTADQQSEILQAAAGLNYWGKRLDTSKAETAGAISDRFFGGSRVSEVTAFLDENKPMKPKKVKAEGVEQEEEREPVFTSLDQHFKTAPVIEKGTYIVFSVQNNASICAPAMATAKMLARHLDAELLPVSCFYKVTIEHDRPEDLAIPCQPAPVWIGSEILTLGGDVLPTAKKPVNHAKLASGDRQLTIIPHVKQQAESLPRMKGKSERWAVSTGTLCQPRYRAGRAGSEASSDHCIGFTVVHASGKFDQVALDEHGQGFYRGIPINEFGFADPAGDAALVLGDIHAEKLDEVEFANALELARDVSAARVVLHDLLDFTSRNHHNRGSGLFLASQMNRTVTDDLLSAGDVISLLQEATDAEIVIVNSNHDRALDRWLEEADPRQDPVNLPLWCSLQSPRYESALKGNKDDLIPLERALRLVCKHLDFKRIKFLNRDESCISHGVELGHHGDCGINGARGGYTAFERLGGCYAIGHSHSGYKNGKRVVVVGVTGSMDMGYNVGASSWSHSHAVITSDGVPQIIAK